MTHITHFTFDRAQYQVTDSEGNTAILKMNYAGNSYAIDGVDNELIRRIAQDLLRKKHGANFAYKFSQYKVE